MGRSDGYFAEYVCLGEGYLSSQLVVVYEDWKSEHVRWSQLAQAERSQPRAHVDTCLDALSLDHTSEEATCKGITSTIGVVDLALVNRVHRESLDVVLALHGDNGRIGSLGDDCHTLALLVFLWQVGKVLSDCWDIVGVEVMRVGVRNGLGLVSNNVIPVR